MSSPRLLLAVTLSLASACAWNPNDKVRVRIDLDPGSASFTPASAGALIPILPDFRAATVPTPSNLSDFACFAVNVSGPGIPGYSMGYGRRFGAELINGEECSYEGITSDVVGQGRSEIVLEVPSGPARRVQVMGIATSDACVPGGSFEAFRRARYAAGSDWTTFDVGSTVADLFNETTVAIQGNYAMQPAFNCEEGIPLQPIRVATGYENGAGFPDTSPAGEWPSSYTAENAGLSPLLPALRRFGRAVAAKDVSGISQVSRMDFLFDANSVPPYAGTHLVAEALVEGGITNGSVCDLADLNPANSGVELRVESTAGVWSSSQGMTSGTGAQKIRFATQYESTNAATYRSALFSTLPAGNYARVSVRTRFATGSTNCAMLRVHGIRVFYSAPFEAPPTPPS